MEPVLETESDTEGNDLASEQSAGPIDLQEQVQDLQRNQQLMMERMEFMFQQFAQQIAQNMQQGQAELPAHPPQAATEPARQNQPSTSTQSITSSVSPITQPSEGTTPQTSSTANPSQQRAPRASEVPQVDKSFWDLDPPRKAQALTELVQLGAQTYSHAFSIQDKTKVFYTTIAHIPDGNERFPALRARNATEIITQYEKIPLSILIDALTRDSGTPYSMSTLITRLKQSRIDPLPSDPTSENLKRYALTLGEQVERSLETLKDYPDMTDLADKALTDWFISKWPPPFREDFTKKAETLNFSLDSLVRHLTSFTEQSDPAYKIMSACTHAHMFKGSSDKQPRPANKTEIKPTGKSTGTTPKDKPKDFKTRYKLPDSSKDLPEQLRMDKETCKVYDETKVFDDVCFKCGSYEHHTRQCSNESPTPGEQERGAAILKAFKTVSAWAKDKQKPRRTAPS